MERVMIKRILVAVDGSEHALNAAAVAADLAMRFGADLTVLHVMPHSGTSIVPSGLEEYERIENIFISEKGVFEAAAKSIVERAARRALEEGHIKVDEMIEVGPPAETIAEVANRLEADMVVLGSRGLSDLQGLLLGSVSHKVGYLAHCTVLTVK
jgi:nucleotide-binding universal stress UspA family protein